jgi:hypothetical protein
VQPFSSSGATAITTPKESSNFWDHTMFHAAGL